MTTLLSMTGYGAAERPVGRGRIVVELRSVNHRYLDVRIRLPSELGAQTASIEDLLRKRMLRGRVEMTARREGLADDCLELDFERAKRAFQQLEALRDEIRPDDAVPFSMISTIPDLYRRSTTTDSEVAVDALNRATLDACDALEAMRQGEGHALAQEILHLLDRATALVETIDSSQVTISDELRSRLRARIQKLLGPDVGSLDPNRIEQEIALQVDRADVTEEIARMHSHLRQARKLLEEDSSLKGRKLDFIVQEMGREANTITSKTHDPPTLVHAIDLKTTVERLREQTQNVL